MIYFNGATSDNYFEGWFFKISDGDFNCALIPSMSVSNKEKRAYIQFNCNNGSGRLEFDISDFSANDREVKIGGNHFSVDGIYFCGGDLLVDVKFGEFSPLEKDIMGCFKHGTPCKHRIISMRHSVSGRIVYRGQERQLFNALGYAEKDWGGSFPSEYCWLQCNDFAGENAAFFCSVAKLNLPLRGFICSLVVGEREYRFATYNFSVISKLQRGKITLKKFGSRLEIEFITSDGNPLLAPNCGSMERTVGEYLNGTVELRLFERGKLLYACSGRNAGVEWVNL